MKLDGVEIGLDITLNRAMIVIQSETIVLYSNFSDKKMNVFPFDNVKLV